MDARKRAALEAAGWKFGDATDFLEIDDAERQAFAVNLERGMEDWRRRQEGNPGEKRPEPST